MKRMMAIAVGLMLLISLAGCGSKEPEKTEEQIREEVRLEMEAEQKAKEEAQSQKTADIKDDEGVFEFLNEKYPGKYSRDGFSEWKAVYSDFTGDGTKDAVYYFEGNIDRIIFISADGGIFNVIENEIEQTKIYAQKISRKGEFIVHTIRSGGSGLEVEVENLYAYDGEKIVYTGASLIMEGHESQMPTSDYPDGYSMAMKGEIDGEVYDFVYTYTRTDENKNEAVETIQTSYKYDPNTYKFDIEEIENSNYREDENQAVDEGPDTAENIPGEQEKDYYDPADLKVGSGVGYLMVEYIKYEKGRELLLRLDGSKIYCKGIISGYYDESFGQNVYVFSSKEDILEKPIIYQAKDGSENKIENIRGEITNYDNMDEKIREYIMEGNEIEVTAEVGLYGYTYCPEEMSFIKETMTLWRVYVESDIPVLEGE